MAYAKISRVRVVPKDSIEDRRVLWDANRIFNRAQEIRRSRRKGLDKNEVQLVNILKDIGFGPSVLVHQALEQVPARLQGKKVSLFQPETLDFLRENYDAKQVTDEDCRVLLAFPQKGENIVNLFSEIAKEAGHPRRVVSEVYDALWNNIMHLLKKEGRVRLPDLGIIKVKSIPARKKRFGKNPFTGKEQWFKAKPASNKVKFTPAKVLKEEVAKLKVKLH